jgi:hypothetical protein
MSGVSSQPPGRAIGRRAPIAFGGVSSQPPGLPLARRALISLGSLGADDASITSPTLVDPETRAYRQRIEKYQQDLIAGQEADKMQKWIAIGATISIPVFAAIWRLIGVGRRKST